MMQYALGVDLRDYDRIRNCFASSFRAVYGAHEFTDGDALIDFISGVEHFASTTHFLGSTLIDVDGDVAWMVNHALITHRPNEADPSADWVAASRYVDRLVREDGRWRIAERGPSAVRGRVGPAPAPVSEDTRVRRLLDRAAIQDIVVASAHASDAADGRHRVLNNQMLEIDGDDAKVETYLYVTEPGEGGRPSPWSRGARRWVDRLRRDEGAWSLVDRSEVDNRVDDELVIDATEAAARAGGRREHVEG
jgi:hypothetical protein